MNATISEKTAIIITLIGFCLIATVSGFYAGLTFGIVFFGLYIFVETVNRENKELRNFVKRSLLLVIIFLSVVCVVELLIPPVSAIDIDVEQYNDQIIFTWYPPAHYPYKINYNEKLIDEYWFNKYAVSANPGEYVLFTIYDNNGDWDYTEYYMKYYTFPLQVWLLIGLFIILCILSIRNPYASFSAMITGGFLMLYVATDPLYLPYLRIIAASAFIVGLGTLFIQR